MARTKKMKTVTPPVVESPNESMVNVKSVDAVQLTTIVEPVIEELQEQNEPTIMYMFYKSDWLHTISPVSKLELMDWVATVDAIMYYTPETQSYNIVLKASSWEPLDTDRKVAFQHISRRIREELEGPFTFTVRTALDTMDPFDAFFNTEQPSESEQPSDSGGTLVSDEVASMDLAPTLKP